MRDGEVCNLNLDCLRAGLAYVTFRIGYRVCVGLLAVRILNVSIQHGDGQIIVLRAVVQRGSVTVRIACDDGFDLILCLGANVVERNRRVGRTAWFCLIRQQDSCLTGTRVA